MLLSLGRIHPDKAAVPIFEIDRVGHIIQKRGEQLLILAALKVRPAVFNGTCHAHGQLARLKRVGHQDVIHQMKLVFIRQYLIVILA